MPGPGSGRYTNYTPANTGIDSNSVDKYLKRQSLFNAKAANKRGEVAIQAKIVADAASAFEAGKGDLQMFPLGVNMSYGDAPLLGDAQVNRPGDPANPYVPDLSSPGALDGKINVSPLEKDGQGSISATGEDGVKPNYILPTTAVDQSSDSLGTQSPSLTSPLIGTSPLLKPLVMGKSRGTQGGSQEQIRVKI